MKIPRSQRVAAVNEEEELDNLVHAFRFPILLFALFAAVLVPPYFEGMALLDTVWRIIFSFVMLFAMAALVGTRKSVVVGVLALVPAFATNWASIYTDATWVIYADNITTIIYFSIIGYYISRYVFTSSRVTSNVLYAAMCLYLVIAVVWAAIYNNLHIFYPNAFGYSSEALRELANNPDSTLGLFTYFSFVTMTTLGYGDIVPLTRVTQSWAAVESMVGQFYIAIVMARLVSLHTANRVR